MSAGLTTTSARDASAAEDTFTARLSTAAGAQVVLQQTAAAWGPMVSTTRVVGDRGAVWLDRESVWLATAAEPYGRLVDPPDDLRLPHQPSQNDDPRHRFTHLELGPSIRQAEAFRDAILGVARRNGPQPATFDDGVANTAVLDALRAPGAVTL
jgi:predicted dehydrogenase